MSDILERIEQKLDRVVMETASLKANMQSLLGNGQPGIIKELQDDTENLKSWRDYIIGGGSFFMFLIGIFEWLIHRK